jgi:hypothetical protein
MVRRLRRQPLALTPLPQTIDRQPGARLVDPRRGLLLVDREPPARTLMNASWATSSPALFSTRRHFSRITGKSEARAPAPCAYRTSTPPLSP